MQVENASTGRRKCQGEREGEREKVRVNIRKGDDKEEKERQVSGKQHVTSQLPTQVN